jgi:hypothetical protein
MKEDPNKIFVDGDGLTWGDLEKAFKQAELRGYNKAIDKAIEKNWIKPVEEMLIKLKSHSQSESPSRKREVKQEQGERK